ncbi:hypothetical protein [Deinococcus sonorensis]|uniref:WYL domain-containing protein n=2 Tax=Deinococcus sonorensis TaxID=309891 RepID=A0AAU7UGG5_9DEIO
MTTSPPTRKHHQDRPDFTAALRTAAWTYRLTETPFAPKDIQAEVQRARQGMGLAPYRGGAVSDYLQRRTRGTKLQAQDNQPVHYESVDRRLVPTARVLQNWRFLSAADHAEIRLTADQGHFNETAVGQYRFVTRGSHLPSLTVLIGTVTEVCATVEAGFKDRRGLYLLKRNGRNYAGQTREFHTRGRSHGATGAERVIFAFPDETLPVNSDELNVAESLAIVSLTELLDLENVTLGGDARPQPKELREGSLFALTFVAAIAKWAQLHRDAGRQLLVWRTDVRGLEDAYLTLQPYTPPVAAQEQP